jgi:4-hydroxymandelate synthase
MQQMATTPARVFRDLTVDHIKFYVQDLAESTRWLAGGYGFDVLAESAGTDGAEVRTVVLGTGGIRLLLTQPLKEDHAGAAYLEKHGDGVADIGLGVPDAAVAFAEAVRRGARPVSAPAVTDGIRTAAVMAFGDVVHTFVERPEGSGETRLPGLPGPLDTPSAGTGLLAVDHFAVCVEAGQLNAAVAFYEKVLGFTTVFAERVEVGDQAITTKAVQSESGEVTLTLIEPDASQVSGQIDTFLKDHGGPGVQHIAFSTDDIVRTVDAVAGTGIRLLSTPDAYYELLAGRMKVARHSVGELRRLGILVDEDHDGQLFQIFAKSVHPRGTVFLEVIERMGAQAFGGGNIAALYRAVELQRQQDDVVSTLADASAASGS